MGESLRVIHVGVVGRAPSGMAQVVNEYLSWSIPGVTQTAIATTRGRRDPRAPALLVRAMLLLAFRRALRRVDTVAVHMSERGSFLREGLVVGLAHLLGLRVVVHLHGATFESFAARRPRLVSAVLRRADAIAALTFQSEQLAGRLAPATRTTLVPNAVKVPPLSTLGRNNSFFFAGELGERKGVDTLLAAWKSLGDARGDWELHIAGPDSTNMIKAAGPLPGMRYHGTLPHDEVLALAERTRVAVLPSREEALPMFLLETMAHGNLPVGTAVGQVQELLDNVGLILEPGNVTDLTNAMRHICDGAIDIHRLGSDARARVEERYSSDRVCDLLLDLWRGRSLLEKDGRAS